ncbi:MAG: hypothetical protein PHE55_05920 [Methylococcaceae bacterium]|nr:hypothetical protein [Methylococcaceae bacterium]
MKKNTEGYTRQSAESSSGIYPDYGAICLPSITRKTGKGLHPYPVANGNGRDDTRRRLTATRTKRPIAHSGAYFSLSGAESMAIHAYTGQHFFLPHHPIRPTPTRSKPFNNRRLAVQYEPNAITEVPMSTINVLANGPINFTAKDGSQKSLPISDISYAGGKFHIAPEWLSANKIGGKDFDENDITPLLGQLNKEGVLQTVETPSTSKAMVVTAADVGALGNTIEVSFSKFQRPAGGTVSFDVTVTETIIYKNVTPTTVKTILGATADEKPGMIFVSSAGTPKIPGKADNPYPLAGDPAKAQILDATAATAFEVTAKKGGPDSALITVAISELTSTDFTLTAVWSKTATGMTAATLKANPFSYKIKIDPPITGGDLGIPSEGIVKLFGGVDAQSATSASAVVIAG